MEFFSKGETNDHQRYKKVTVTFAIQINILLINHCCLRLCQVERQFGRLQPGNARTRKWTIDYHIQSKTLVVAAVMFLLLS